MGRGGQVLEPMCARCALCGAGGDSVRRAGSSPGRSMCGAGQRGRCRELQTRESAERVGRLRRRGPEHPGLRHGHQRRPGSAGHVQGRYGRRRLQARHLPDGLVWRERRPPRRHGSAVRDASAEPGCLHGGRRDRSRRRWKLGNHQRSRSVPGDAVSGIYFAHLVREDGTSRREPRPVHRPRRRRSFGSPSRPRTRPGRRTTASATTAWTRADRARTRAVRTRSRTTRRPTTRDPLRARGLGFQRRVPDGSLARAQRIRRLVLHRRRQRPSRRRNRRAQGLHVGRP